MSVCRAARVRKVETTKAKRATKRELIVVAIMISRMIGTSVFSDGTEFSVTTGHGLRDPLGQRLAPPPRGIPELSQNYHSPKLVHIPGDFLRFPNPNCLLG